MLLLMLLLPNAATGAATWCCYCVLLLDAATHAAPKCFGMQVHKIKNARTNMRNSMRIPMHLQTCPLKDPRMKSMKGRSVHTSEATCKSDRSTWVPPVYMRACPKKLNPNRRTWNTQWTRCYQKVNSSTNDHKALQRNRGVKQ